MKDVIFTTIVGSTVLVLVIVAAGLHKGGQHSRVVGVVGGGLLFLAGYTIGQLLAALAVLL